MRHDARRTRVPRAVFRTLAAISGAITKTRRQTMFLSMRTVAKLFGRRKKFGPNILRLFVGSIENSCVFFQGFRRIAEIGSKIYCTGTDCPGRPPW